MVSPNVRSKILYQFHQALPTCTAPDKLADWLEQTKLESGTALLPSKDAICHMIGDVVVFLCLLTILFGFSALQCVVYISHGVTDGIADWITLA